MTGIRNAGVLSCIMALAVSTSAFAQCRLALALGMDISSSVNRAEYDIQLRGLAAAFRDPEVIAAALAEPDAYVMALPFEWSGRMQQEAIGTWTPLQNTSDIAAFADRMDAHQRRYENFSTGIGTAVEFALEAFDALPVMCERLVIDLSGDGVNNDGPAAIQYFGQLDRMGVTLNALVIAGSDPDPVQHYAAQVIYGPDAFLMIAEGGFEDYPELIKAKLIREMGPPMLIGALPRDTTLIKGKR